MRESLQAGKLHHAPVLPHLAFGDEQGAQAAAVTKLDIAQVNDEVLGLPIAEDQELPFQFRGNGRVKLSFLDLQDRRFTILLDFELHGILLLQLRTGGPIRKDRLA
jgi:hypothetical protein